MAKLWPGWWRDLDALARAEVAQHPGKLDGWLREHSPLYRSVGRVTFHLAENKRDPDFPFAFLATFSNGVTPQGKVRHEPLGRALQQHAGANDRAAMLNLLLPVSRAAESSELIRRLVDSGEIYHPLAWSAREAYDFLRAVPLFESSGLIVRVPDWWNAKKPPRPQVSVRIDSKQATGINVDEMLNFSVDLSLGGESLGADEMAQLLESTGGLIPLRGKWVEVDPEKLKQALDHWKGVERDVRREGISFHEGMRLLSGANLGDDGKPGPNLEAIREWSGLSAGASLDAILSELRSPENRQHTPPPGLRAELRPYQQTGFGWLRFVTRLGLGACLADDMGLGKTIQVIALLLDLKRVQTKPTARAASLLVVPASLIANWKAELARFAPDLSFAVVHPSEPTTTGPGVGADTANSFDLVVTTYGMVVRTDWLRKHRWRVAILDEAQAIKNSGTKQTRAVKELTAGSRVALTGTPIENRVSDLWSLFDFLNPGLLGPPKKFASFVRRLQDGPAASFEPLRNLVQPYILRRLKTDRRVIADLPDKTEVNAYCTLSKAQAALYQHAVDDLARQLRSTEEGGIQRRGIVLAQLMRLKQICNHPAQATGTHDYAPDRSGKFRPPGRAGRGDRRSAGEGSGLHPVPRDHRADQRLFGWSVRSRGTGPPRRNRRPEAAGPRRAVPARGRTALLRPVTQSGWDRPEPHRRVARHPLRPLVEPSYREPGDRPRVSNRPEAERPGSQVHLPGDGRGAYRRHDRRKEPRRPGTDWRRVGRIFAHRDDG